MNERHSLIELRTMWTASRDFCQRQMDAIEKSPLAGTPEDQQDYEACVKHSQEKIDTYTALLSEKILDDIVGITLA